MSYSGAGAAPISSSAASNENFFIDFSDRHASRLALTNPHPPFASSEVEKPARDQRVSTSLDTNGWGKSRRYFTSV
jgi:hypothetical protein